MDPKLEPIFFRRSVRAYQDRPLTEEHKQIIIQGAMRAPTAGNMMMYSMLEVADPAMKEKLVTTCDNQSFIAKAPFILIFLADMQRLYDYYAVSGVPQKCKQNDLPYRTPKESDFLLASCDALIAAQNAVITAEALGIGSCYIGDIMENIEKHRQMFDLPIWTFPIAMVCFGYPKSQIPPAERNLIKRFPEKYVHFVDKYEKNTPEGFSAMWDYMAEMAQSEIEKKDEIDNFGQLLYFRKTGAEFSHEMERSAHQAMKDWLDGH